MTARSLAGSLPTSVAVRVAPSKVRTVMSSLWLITWAFVMTRPSADSTTPLPAPSNTPPRAVTLVSMVTTDGCTWSRMLWTSMAPSGVVTGGRATTGVTSRSGHSATALTAAATTAPTRAATRPTAHRRAALVPGLDLLSTAGLRGRGGVPRWALEPRRRRDDPVGGAARNVADASLTGCPSGWGATGRS